MNEFLDRDISWLEFNRRVLQQALDDRTPLLERVTFLGIFTSNLDEFFMKRVGRLYGLWRNSSPSSQSEYHDRLVAIRDVVSPMLAELDRCYQEEIRLALNENGIQILSYQELSDHERTEADRYFHETVFPIMTPQAVDPSHPFPFISNLSDSLGIALRYPDRAQRFFARVKVPHQLPPLIELSSEADAKRFTNLRDVIRNNLEPLFPGMIIEDVLPMRVTRSAQVDEVDPEEGEDILEQVEEELRRRRLQNVVRLEHGPNPNRWLLEQVIRELKLLPEQVYEVGGELDYTDLRRVGSLPIEHLRFPEWVPVVPAALKYQDLDIFSAIRQNDILIHHPYESFDATVGRFIHSAVQDDNVLAIKMTLYRTSDDTPFVPWLVEAAEAGKQVACLIELKARFDEQRNIRWANALEDAGVHVVYGVIGKKTHTKTSLVVRREGDRIRSYAHIGTGNYHPQTARLYTDIGLLTCEPKITGDIIEMFHYLTGRSLKDDYDELLVAPVNMKRRFLELIEREIAHHQDGHPAHIVAKMNQLEDEDICRMLYKASQAGLPVDLIVRGFCTLRPGVVGMSENIRVISVIGQFLEHSRIYYFRNGQENARDGEFYMGSADWMHRNLEDRVEVVTPIQNESFRIRLWDILRCMLSDQRQTWDMQPDGSYTQRFPADNSSEAQRIGVHQWLSRETLKAN